MKTSGILALAIAALSLALAAQIVLAQDAQPPPPYALPVPALEPVLFAPGVVKGSGPAFSPDGKAVYTHNYAEGKGHTILVSHYRDGHWTPSQVAEFSGTYDELEPAISSDGNQLLFCSTRPVNGERIGLQIWSMHKTNTGWGEPQLMPAPVTAQGRRCGIPSLARDGSLYFGVRSGTGWPWEIFWSHCENGIYAEPVNVNDAINPGGRSWSHAIAPDQSFLIFVGVIDAGTPRPDSLGKADLYVSFRDGEKWLPGINLGPKVNTSESEVWPRISPDGRYLFFNRQGPDARGIFQIALEPLLAPLRREAPANPTAAERPPAVERFAAQAAHGLTFGPEGRLYISGGRRISQLTPDGAISLLAELPETSAEIPRVWNLAWHDGQLFGAAHDRIVRIAADGTVTNLIEEAFPGPCGVSDLVFDARGNLYVAYDRQIACYTPDLKKRVVLDGTKTNPVMRWITSLCIDHQGRFWISDVRRKRVFLAELDTDGMLQVKRVFDLPEHPEYLAVAGNGTVYVGFPDANSIARLDDGGTHRMIPLGGQLNYPVGMSFGGSGFERDVLFIASRSGIYLVRLAPDSLERSP